MKKILLTYPEAFPGPFLRTALEKKIALLTPRADYLDIKIARKVFSGTRPDAVVLNIPFSGGILLNRRAPAELMLKNLDAQSNVIRTACERGIRKLYFIGSSCMYPGNINRPMGPMDLLTGPLEETNFGYATAKIAGWQMCRAFNRQSSTRYMTIIPANLFGEFDEFEENKSHVVAALLQRFDRARALKAPSTTVWGSGKPVRDFIYAAEFADALSFLIKNDIFREVINVGSGCGYSIRAMARLIAKTVGYRGRIMFDNSKPDGMRKKVLDTSELASLGWRPKLTLAEGLLKTYNWYQSKIGEKRS